MGPLDKIQALLLAVLTWAVAVFLALQAVQIVQGAPACHTLREARAIWPRAHLWWFRDAAGRRCWSSTRGVGRWVPPSRPAPAPLPVPPPPPIALPFWLPPAELALPPRTPTELERWPLVRFPGVEASEARAEGEILYTTFSGPAPDVWPELEPAVPWPGWLWLSRLLALAAIGLAGLELRRIWLSRLNITKEEPMRHIPREIQDELDRLPAPWRTEPGRRHIKIFVGDRLAGILPWGSHRESRHRRELMNTRAQLRRAAAAWANHTNPGDPRDHRKI